MTRTHPWLPILLGAASVTLAAAQEPTATEPRARLVDPPARLVVENIPNVLDDEAVARHLDTGLTSTLILSAHLRGVPPASHGAALQMDIRYDLWDEVYLIEVTGSEDGERSRRVESRSDLSAWWSELRLELTAPATPPDRPLEVDVSLSLVPFSEAERRDTELWFSRAAGGAQPAGAETGTEGGELGGLLELVMTSSIRREELLRYDWRVVVE